MTRTSTGLQRGTAAQSSENQQRLYQQLLTCMRGSWHSLVVIPAEPGISVYDIADALVEVSSLVRGTTAALFNAEGQGINAASKIIVDMVSHVDADGLAVVAIDSVVDKQAGVPIVMAADAALLCVHLGRTQTFNAQKTIEIVGAEKFIGALTIEKDPRRRS